MTPYLPDPRGARGLDVGCGGGINTLDLAAHGYDMTGIDCESALIDVARTQADKQQLCVHWSVAQAQDLPRDELFDFICCYEVLEHVNDLESTCRCLLNSLKPGGFLFISTLSQTLKSYITAITLGEYLLRYLPIGTHEFEKFIKPGTLNKLLAPALCLDLCGMIYNPFEKKFFLGESLSVQYIGVWQKPF